MMDVARERGGERFGRGWERQRALIPGHYAELLD